MKPDVSPPRFTPGVALGTCRFVYEPLDHRSQGNKQPDPPKRPAPEWLWSRYVATRPGSTAAREALDAVLGRGA